MNGQYIDLEDVAIYLPAELRLVGGARTMDTIDAFEGCGFGDEEDYYDAN